MMELFSTPQRYRTQEAENALLGIDERLLRFSAAWSGNYGALLTGPTGCGKSLAAATALRRVTLDQPRHWSAWVRSDVYTRIAASREHQGDVARVKSCHVVVLDELGYERFPEAVLELIGDRYDRNLPTVVTTGLEAEAFLSRYGDATARKITSIGGGFAVNCWGDKSVVIPDRKSTAELVSLQNESPWSGHGILGAHEIGLPGFS
jgi:DNA replication protein DnaC